MNTFWVFFIMFLFVTVISWLWVNGIDNMKNNYPNYKGEDFLSWDDDEDDKNDTESTFKK